MRRNKNKYKVKLNFADGVWNVFKLTFYILMVLFALSYVVPLLYLIVNSLKTAPEYMKNVFSLPKSLDWDNYMQILTQLKYKGYGIFGMVLNTLVYTAWSVVSSLTFPHMAAYALARFDTKAGRFLETMVWVTMAIPVIGSSSSWMWFLNLLGLYDTWGGMFLMGISGLGFGSILLKNFYGGVNKTYAEAAYIDGATEWKIFSKIYFPQARALATITAVNAFIGAWNNYMGPYLYLPSKPTISLGVQQLQTQFVYFGNDYPVMFAGIIIIMIPIIIVYLKFADQMISNVGVGIK